MNEFSLAQSSQLGYRLFCESAADTHEPAAVVLGVLDGKRMCLGLIVEIHQGAVDTVKSLDSKTMGAPLTLSAESFERMWYVLAQNRNVLAALLCDRETFEGLVNAENKLGYLAAVGHSQPYFYRVQVH